MFDFGYANDEQRAAIKTTEGPVLITAGPGTGKTFTLVRRAVYLIEALGVQPEQILMATFTEKAAKELVTRITNELAERNIAVNINEMYIGTIHSICLRIVKEYLEYTRLKKNYRTLDDFDQRYTVYQNIRKFRAIDGYGDLIEQEGAWREAGKICDLVNNLAEELVDPAELMEDTDKEIAALGRVLEAYLEVLSENNLLDFCAIQTEAYNLLVNNPKILAGIRDKIRYLMIDEYQDTNYIQEQITLILGGGHNNICVVGDDDQGLYRFRGATIRNIIEFPGKFEKGECKIVQLVKNYRSNIDIVDFYNKWMTTTKGNGFGFEWNGFRHNKKIEPVITSKPNSPAAVKLSCVGDDYTWYTRILSFIRELMKSGKVKDYNQIAFLYVSVKNDRILKLADFLEENGVKVYSPRSNMFFQRDEIMLLTGCLILMFPEYAEGLKKRSYEFLSDKLYDYYSLCVYNAERYFSQGAAAGLAKLVRDRAKAHKKLKGTTDYAYSALLYEMFAHWPFKEIIDQDMGSGVIGLRSVRNIALFTQIVGKFEYLHNVSVLDSSTYNGRKRITQNTENLFNNYIRMRYNEGITEHEEEMEYAPSGCVSFFTIHQAKGLEFPIVFVDSLSNQPSAQGTALMERVEAKYFKRQPFEPYRDIKYFDFWRLLYTAFSRAQDLLILTCKESGYTPTACFKPVYDELPELGYCRFSVGDFDFKEVKNAYVKDTFSFTSHITVYENCSLQYKFYNELEFAPVRASAMLFGLVVHQTIEDVHRAALRDEAHLITPDNIEIWFDTNYSSISQNKRSYLAEAQKKAALGQVLAYAERQAGEWGRLMEAEVSVSLVKPDYIIEGKIDLIQGEDKTVELVDFKTEKKPVPGADTERIDHYRKQLEVYAHLVEERTGQKVSRMHLYYTGEEGGDNTISFPYKKQSIDSTIKDFDDTVHKILRKEYDTGPNSKKLCSNCDFRHHCGKS